MSSLTMYIRYQWLQSEISNNSKHLLGRESKRAHAHAHAHTTLLPPSLK